MSLSQEELTKLKARLALSSTPITTDDVISVKPSLASKIKEDFSSRVGKAQEAQSKSITGQQSLGGATLQTLGQGAGFVGDVVGETVMSAGKAVLPKKAEEVIASGASALFGSKPVETVISEYQQFKEKYPEASANIESILNIGSLIPVGALGTGAGKTALKGAGSVVGTAGDIIEATGKASKQGAGKIYQSAITPNVKEAEKILQAEIKGTFAPQTRASTALEKGIAGTQTGIAVKGGKIADKLYTDKIIPALESTKGKVTMNKSELFSRVEDRISKTVDPTKKKSLIDAYEAIKTDYADFPDNFDLLTAQNLKKNLDEFTPEKIFRGQNVANELKVLNNDMANAIRSKTYNALEDVNIKKDYLDYGNLKELEKIGVKAITESGRFGGTGTLLSYLSDKALTPVKTIGGQVLYRIGDSFELIGKNGLKTFADYLKANKVKLKAK
jgi:hypothetical protein